MPRKTRRFSVTPKRVKIAPTTNGIDLFRYIFWSLFFITILITSYFFINDKFYPVHDFTAGARIFELHNTVTSGQFPPRWSENFGFGYGMPLFQFYAPLAFILPELFHLAGISILSSLKLGLIVFSVIGFVGSYLLGKQLTNRWGGLITAVAFTLAPYHAVNLYVRGAFAEYVAISLMPLSLYFVLRLLKDEKIRVAYAGLTVVLALIFLSHNVTVITYMPFWLLASFGLAVIYKQLSLKKILPVVLALLNGIVLASFFLIPAFVQKQYTRADTLTEGFSQFQLHFLYFRQLFTPNWKYGGSVWGLEDDMSFYLGNDLLVFAAIGGIIAFWLSREFVRKKAIITTPLALYSLFLVLFLGSVIATNFKSRIIWETLPLVSFIQFPWRFLGVSSFFLAILAGFITLNRYSKWFVVPVVITIMVLNGRFFQPEKLIDPGKLYNPDVEYIQKQMTGILPDYLPPHIDWETYSPPSQPVGVSEGKGTVEVTDKSVQAITLKVQMETPGVVTLNRFVFPNWQIMVNGEEKECLVKDYIYHCPVSAGEQTIQLTWSEQGVNAVANGVSLFGLAGLVGYLLWPKVTRFTNPVSGLTSSKNG